MKFNSSQVACLEAKEDKIIINASAGTGKTTVLIEAAKRAIQDNKKIVIITFTRDAAEVIERKLSYQADFTGTIHGFALREIHKMRKQYIFKNKIMSTGEIKEALIQALMEVDNGIKDGYKQEITRILQYMSSGYYNSRNELQRIFKVLKEYDKIKQSYGLYDFNDTPQYLLELIKQYKWKLDYQGLFVDEVQDIDKHEFELIQKFNCKTFLIGDPLQSIYLFRDSVENVFDKFENLGYNMYILSDNYRSYQEILDYAGAHLLASRGSGGLITDERLLIANPNAQILCRTNREVERLSEHFENVTTIHAFKGLERDDVIVVPFPTGSQESLNIKFVALTRARNRLGIARADDLIKLKRKGVLNGHK